MMTSIAHLLCLSSPKHLNRRLICGTAFKCLCLPPAIACSRWIVFLAPEPNEQGVSDCTSYCPTHDGAQQLIQEAPEKPQRFIAARGNETQERSKDQRRNAGLRSREINIFECRLEHAPLGCLDQSITLAKKDRSAVRRNILIHTHAFNVSWRRANSPAWHEEFSDTVFAIQAALLRSFAGKSHHPKMMNTNKQLS